MGRLLNVPRFDRNVRIPGVFRQGEGRIPDRSKPVGNLLRTTPIFPSELGLKLLFGTFSLPSNLGVV